MTPNMIVYEALAKARDIVRPHAHVMYLTQTRRLLERILTAEPERERLLAWDLNEWCDWVNRETKMPPETRKRFLAHTKIIEDWIDAVNCRVAAEPEPEPWDDSEDVDAAD